MARGPRTGRPAGGDPLQDPTLPILAISGSGIITRANGPAKKVLAGAGDGLEGTNLGSFLGRMLGTSRSLAGRTLLSFLSGHGEGEVVLVVLSDEQTQAGQNPVIVTNRAVATNPASASRLADFIAHELRNPLGTVFGMSQILETRYESLSREDRTAALDTIQSEAGRALLILDGLLRLAEGRVRPRLETKNIPLHGVLRRVVAGHQRRNPDRALTITGDSPLFATANSLWVELALGNLLSNAEKYTPRGRTIEIACQQNGSQASILVLDDGSGLAPERYRSLWNVYAHGPDQEVEVSGSGIGLALCKELVEGMGGHVWAGPRRTGGSVFAISLPSPLDMTVPAALSTTIAQAEQDTATPAAAWA